MWNAAVEVQEEPATQPYHFDLVGLAQGLTKTASTAAKIQKLSAHVRDAKKTLEQHKSHVAEITELMTKAEGDQKTELQGVLSSAQSHVTELQSTVEKAEEEVKKEMEKEDEEKKEKA